MSITAIAGIDEAGRGPLAGPVIAAACILPSRMRIPSMIRDSKVLHPRQREAALQWILRHCAVGIGLRGAAYIDARGILAATEAAMQDAVRMLALTRKPTALLVDGHDRFWFDYPHTSIIRGDVTEPCISAASIVAKVLRDHMMQEAHRRFPLYGFDRHKGYGTEEHRAMIARHGLCPLHRRSFIHVPGAQPAGGATRRKP